MTQTRLNAIDRADVQAELGETEMYRLDYLAFRITSPEIPGSGGFNQDARSTVQDQMRFRSAPSIVVRSEAELFGINMPRFAFRAIVAEKTEQASFVNLRRIGSFVSSVGRRLELGPRDEFISQLRRKCRCVADSLLAVPLWAREYHVITTDLARWYSEEVPQKGTPFVTHFPVGGGMCAQAVCFMASALLHQHGRGVYGVSEVTMMSGTEKDSEETYLNFSGLSVARMTQYFKRIGLTVTPQYAQNVRDYREALRAFLLSGVPVIIPVDMQKL